MKGKWLGYPGDYEIYLAEKVQTRRFVRDFPIGPVWRMDSPWHQLRFVKNITLTKDGEFKVQAEGRFSVCVYKLPEMEYKPFYNFDGTVHLKKGEYLLQCWVYNANGLPCLRIDGEEVFTDKTFQVSNYHLGLIGAAEIDCDDMTPNTWHLPLREITCKTVSACKGGTFYDFGHMVMALPKIAARIGSKFKCYFGETIRETMSDNECEQIDFFTMETDEYQSEIARAFRYMRIIADVPYELTVLEEYTNETPVFAYESNNERMNKIMEVATRTFRLCSREFYLDGIKRDRWVWSGDAYQAFKTEFFYGYNLDKIRKTFRVLFGKSPVIHYINRITDYTMYALIAIWEYLEQCGDKEFLREIYPIAMEHLRFALGRTDDNGFLVGRPEDWTFIDWGAMDKEGALCFEQMLLHLALKAMANVARCLEYTQDAEWMQDKADLLRKQIDEFFWDEARGVYVHTYKNGKQSEEVTAYANVFAILYNLVDGEQAKRIGDALLHANYIPPITTPYMQEYKLACLFKLGQWQAASKEIADYWGGMLDGGATTFWETYTPGETVEKATDMYGRTFGRSQCHIWGASVLYLIPRYYFGIENNIDNGESFVIKPNLELIKDSQITVPLERGSLTVKYYDGVLEVFSTDLDGELVLQEATYPIIHKDIFTLTYNR